MTTIPAIKDRSEHLSDIFTLNHRYTRSVNLERDLESAECLDDYIVTERASHTLGRIISGISDGSPRSWVLTGVYGTGKSAFAHFLASLFSSDKGTVRKAARNILSKSATKDLLAQYPHLGKLKDGVLFAIATAQRESISQTLLRAIHNALESYKGKDKKIKSALLKRTGRLRRELDEGKEVGSQKVLQIIKEVSEIAGSGLFILIDEMGKSLEYAIEKQDTSDVFVLQQICELPQNDSPVFFLGLLHHSFSEYGSNLGTVERNEWLKVQGRFEEIPFTESTAQMIQLICEVIQSQPDSQVQTDLDVLAEAWFRKLARQLGTKLISAKILSRLIPLHPVTALVLPHLFVRYAQNDRSLFSFLTSSEPNSFRIFLEETETGQVLPFFKLAKLYDYFIETSLSNLVLKPNFQRWLEVKQLIDEHDDEDPDVLLALKTIGILNLAGATGSIRATRDLAVLALCDSPNDRSDLSKWNRLIDALLTRGLITYRRQIDELRVWEGSDFDFDKTIARGREKLQSSLAFVLQESHPSGAIVAQKHSYVTGAIRYFESRYFDGTEQFDNLTCRYPGSSGLVGYWVSENPLKDVPSTTGDGRPLVLIRANQIDRLRSNAFEYYAIKDVLEGAVELKSDGVARRELRHRLTQARYLLDESFARSLYRASHLEVWIMGEPILLDVKKGLNAELSKLCDKIFENGITLWNELINRRELTSQGAKARRMVISAMLGDGEKQNLGLLGNGPEMSVFQSVLNRTGIHRLVDGRYEFGRPAERGFAGIWDEIELFCMDATEQSRKLDGLFETLQNSPFGIKSGVIPILFAAVIIAHSDDVGIYKDDFYIPQLGPEHFELLVRDPSRFSVKHFKVAGVRADVFREVENILVTSVGLPQSIRNKSILGVVTPLLRFGRRLPFYSRNTEKLSRNAKEVRKILLQSPEPDEMLFELLPQACGLPAFKSDKIIANDSPRRFRDELALALKEIRETYDQLLSDCRAYLYEVFGVKQDVSRLREDLRTRASYLQGRSIEPILSRFIFTATENSNDDTEWLQSILMTIADKPVDSWTDADSDTFELKLSDIARRFNHLEAINKNNTRLWNGSAEARRVSIIKTDGSELHDIAWIDEIQKPLIEKQVEEILGKISDDKTQQKALLAVLAERILDFDVNRTLRDLAPKKEIENATRIGPVRRKG